MGTNFKIYFQAFIAFLLVTGMCMAARSSLSGTVTDKNTGDVLAGANVYIKEIAIGSATSLDGSFLIMNIPEGDYTLRVEYIGYKAKEVEVSINASKKAQINVELVPDVLKAGEEVIVSAQRKGQVAAINQQLTSDNIMNVVSSDKIQELPDGNAAESVGRISGVSIRRNAGEGQQVIIRGLEPKLNAITVNGVRIPSSDSQNRSVDLSMISSDVLSGIEVFKAPTPDMDAETLGGAVNLVLKEAPDETKAYIKTMGSYSDLNNDWANVKINSQFSHRFFRKKLGLIASAYYENRNRGSDVFEANYDTEGVYDDEGNIDVIAESMTIADLLERRKRYGGSLNLDYVLAPDNVISMTNFYSEKERNIFERAKDYNVGTVNSNSVNTYGTVIDRKTSLLSNGISGTHALFGTKFNWGFSRFATNNNTPYEFELRFRETSAFDQSTLNPYGHPSTFPDAAHNNLDNTSLQRARMTKNEVEDISYTSQLNFELPVKITTKINSVIKFGGKYTTSAKTRDRSRTGEYFYYLGGLYVNQALDVDPNDLSLNSKGMIAIDNFVDSYKSPKDFMDGDYDLTPLLDETLLRDFYKNHKSYFKNDRDVLVDLYDIEETISAGYMMAKLNFGQMLMLLPGFRYEKSDNSYQAVYATTSELYGKTGIDKDTTTTQEYEEFLPHVHMKFKPFKSFDIRASFTKTLARPDFSYVSPRTRIDRESTTIDGGNPNLKHAKATNYDLLFSYYSNRVGLISIGGFYKEIDDIFYRKNEVITTNERSEELGYADPVYRTGYSLSWYTNSKEAQVWGFEFDIQTQLSFLPKPFNGLVFSGNYSRFYSETYFPQYSYEFIYNPNTYMYETKYEEFYRKSKMPGQADQIGNIALGYDYKGFSARISVFYQGKSLYAVGAIPEQDTYTEDYWRWDAAFKQKLTENFSLFLNLVNFTNRDESSYYGANDYPTIIEKFGMNADFGIQWTL